MTARFAFFCTTGVCQAKAPATDRMWATKRVSGAPLFWAPLKHRNVFALVVDMNDLPNRDGFGWDA